MAGDALKVDNLGKAYGSLKAVDDVSFTVAEGELFGLLGPNGAGKTTTISIINNVMEPTSGTVTIFGHDSRAAARQAKRLCGLVPQELALYPTLSARANISFFGRIYGLKGSLLKERVDEALEMVGLADRADDPIDNYSGGMKRRANLASALVGHPRLLFLDEPTVGVDPQSRNHIFESVKRLNEEGMTIIYTSHYMEEVQMLCKKVAIIDHGRLVAYDSTENLIASVGGGLLMIGASKQPQDLADSVRKVEPDAKVTLDDGTAKIETPRAQAALPEIIQLYNRAGVEISSLRVLEPNLETVFLNLTGRELRD